MTMYHVREEDRTLGSRPIDEAFQSAPEDSRFRMPDADLAALMARRGQMDFYIGGAPPAREYDGKAVASGRTLPGFDIF